MTHRTILMLTASDQRYLGHTSHTSAHLEFSYSYQLLAPKVVNISVVHSSFKIQTVLLQKVTTGVGPSVGPARCSIDSGENRRATILYCKFNLHGIARIRSLFSDFQTW